MMIISLIFINFLLMTILILLSVAYLTLFERKILSYINNRKGPNKALFKGVLQPISDAMKLLSKEILNLLIDKFMFMLGPMSMFFLSMIMWMIYPWMLTYFKFSTLYMILILGFSVYPIIFISWSSSSNYSMISALRSIAQMISFEISLFLMLLIFMIMNESYSIDNFIEYQSKMKYLIFQFPLIMMFFSSMLIELNRSPFDLIEGESELISGFNIEYYSSLFTLIFLSEYLNMIFMSLITTIMFMGFSIYSMKFFIMFNIMLSFMMWIRGILPRIRYDNLMHMCWTDYLLSSLIMLINSYMYINFINLS